MKQSYLKTRYTEISNIVDHESGEVLDTTQKKHTYLANTKEQFLLAYTTLIGVFQNISVAEIRVYAFLLEHYPADCKIVVNDIIRQDIAARTKLSPGSINNTLNRLISTDNTTYPLLYRLGRGTYQLNPRYAFQGSTANRNQSLKAIIELGCTNC